MNTLPAVSATTTEAFRNANISHGQFYSAYQVSGHDFVVSGWSPEDANEVAKRLLELADNASVSPVGIARNEKAVECQVKTTNPEHVRLCKEESERLFQGMVEITYRP